ASVRSPRNGLVPRRALCCGGSARKGSGGKTGIPRGSLERFLQLGHALIEDVDDTQNRVIVGNDLQQIDGIAHAMHAASGVLGAQSGQIDHTVIGGHARTASRVLRTIFLMSVSSPMFFGSSSRMRSSFSRASNMVSCSSYMRLVYSATWRMKSICSRSESALGLGVIGAGPVWCGPHPQYENQPLYFSFSFSITYSQSPGISTPNLCGGVNPLSFQRLLKSRPPGIPVSKKSLMKLPTSSAHATGSRHISEPVNRMICQPMLISQRSRL